MKSKFMRSAWVVLLVSISALILSYVFGTRDIREAVDRAEATMAEIDIRQISDALKMYRMQHGAYPTSSEGLEAVPHIWHLLDPWGNPYVYRIPGRSKDFEVYTLGADGREGGTGVDADVGTGAL